LSQCNPSLLLEKLREIAEKNVKHKANLLINYFKILDYMLIFETLVYDENPALFEQQHLEVRKCALKLLRNFIQDRKFLEAIGNIECNLNIDNIVEKAREAWKIVSENRFEGSVGEKELVLYIIEVAGIQKYVYTSGGALIDVQGASIHVDSACWLIGNKIKEIYGEEALIQAAAGETVVLLPKKIANKIINKVEEYVKNNIAFKTLPLKSNNNYILEVKFREAYDKISGVFGKLYRAALNTTRYISNIAEDINILPRDICKICYNEKGEDRNFWKNNDTLRRIVGNYEIIDDFLDFAMRSGEVERIGEECLIKRLYAYVYRKTQGKESKEKIKRIYGLARKLGVIGSSAYRLSHNIGLACRKIEIGEELFPRSLDDYNYNGRNALIMLVHGDGDGFGSRKTKARTVTEFRILSYTYFELMKKALLSAAVKSIENHYDAYEDLIGGGRGQYQKAYLYPVLPIYFGGDDFVIIGKAEIVLQFLQGFHNGLCKAYNELKDLIKKVKVNTITVSMGIAIGKTKTPIFMLYEGSQEILRHVKEVGENVRTSLGVKADFVYFRGRYSRDYLKNILSHSKKLKAVSLIIFDEISKTINYPSILREIIGCNKSKMPIVSVSDLTEYVDAGYEGKLRGEWLVLKLAYDASRFKENKDKYSVLRYLAENLAKINNDSSWVILLKILDLYDIIKDFGAGLTENRLSESVYLPILCKNLLKGESVEETY